MDRSPADRNLLRAGLFEMDSVLAEVRVPD